VNLKKFIPCNLILIFFITSCTFTPTINPILDSNQCDPPCWNNIIPGKTTADEAEAILKSLKGVVNGSIVQLTSDGTDYEFFVFNMVGYENDIVKKYDNDTGHVYFRNNTVFKIVFAHQGSSLIDPGGLFDITIHDMQKYIGEPEYIYIIRGTIGSNIVYFDDRDKGIYYGSVAGGVHNRFPNLLDLMLNKITPHSYIDYVQYYDPNQDVSPIYYPTGVQFKWNGFGNLDEKYPLSDRISNQ
jgi:hypothetical protein